MFSFVPYCLGRLLPADNSAVEQDVPDIPLSVLKDFLTITWSVDILQMKNQNNFN